MDVDSGRREVWKNFGPTDLAGVQRYPRLAMTADGSSYVYSTERLFCTLFVVEGLK
jgi:hypothetical protein